MTSAKGKYLIYQEGSAELIQVVTGGGVFSNSDQLLSLGGKRRDRKKNRDNMNDTTLKGLV